MNRTKQETAESILFTDMYQLTMAQVYCRMGLHEKRVQFDHYFRDYPDYGTHKAGYCINAGLEWLLDWMELSHFGGSDVEYLRGLKSRSGGSMFAEDFLGWLRQKGRRPVGVRLDSGDLADVERLDPGVRRMMYPHIYHGSLTQRLWDLKQDLIHSTNSKP